MKTSVRKTRRPPPAAGALNDPALQRLFARMTGASAFSANAQEIVQLANRSSGSLEDLQRLIQTDPSLVALLLRRVNSAYYRLDQYVQDLTVAARLLGFREFRNLAITVYLSRMFEMPMDFGSFRTAGLWSHCLHHPWTDHVELTLGSSFLLDMFSQPEIDQCLGRNPSITGLGFDL